MAVKTQMKILQIISYPSLLWITRNILHGYFQQQASLAVTKRNNSRQTSFFSNIWSNEIEDVLLSSMVLKHCLPYLITNWGSQMTHFKKSLTSNKTYMISHQQTQPHCCRAIASLRDLTRTCLKPEHPVCWERYLTVLKCPPLVCRPGP